MKRLKCRSAARVAQIAKLLFRRLLIGRARAFQEIFELQYDRGSWVVARSAGWQPAKQQVSNLRYNQRRLHDRSECGGLG